MNSHPQSEIWPEVLGQLKTQMTRATFDTWLANSRLIEVAESTYVVEVASSQAVDWLEHRLKDMIEGVLGRLLEAPVAATFVAKTETAFEPLDHFTESPQGVEEGGLSVTAAYYDQRNALIQPDRVEVYSQYFRRKWRPLLGRLLSELVRELRQRCYFAKNGTSQARNSFGVTIKELAEALGVSERTMHELAEALGVSERTMHRALKRDENGVFANKYLSHFIQDIAVLKKFDSQKGKFVNEKTQFVIYVDEPLTPEDQAKISN